MTGLVAQSTELALFRDEPGGSLIQIAHRELTIAIRQILVGKGLVIEVWTMVVNVYLISTQDWGAYCRKKIMEKVDEKLAPWLAKSKQIGQSEEEQAALMNEFVASLRKNKTGPQLIGEDDMPLNDQDKKYIEDTFSRLLTAQEKNKTVDLVQIRWSWKEVVSLVVILFSGWFWLDSQFSGLDERLKAKEVPSAVIQQSLDRIEKKLEAPTAFSPTTTSTGSR